MILFSGCENAWLIQYANDVNIRNLNEATCQSPAELAGVRLAEAVEMAQKCNIEVVDDDTQGMWPTHTQSPTKLISTLDSFVTWHHFNRLYF